MLPLTLSRIDWLLALFGAQGGSFALDQIRVMKGLFLLMKEEPSIPRGTFNFTPYNYGAFDAGVYRDLESLASQGLIQITSLQGTSRQLFTLTDEGREKSLELLSALPPPVRETVTRIKVTVTSLGFVALLRDVYQRYPEFAANSRARL